MDSLPTSRSCRHAKVQCQSSCSKPSHMQLDQLRGVECGCSGHPQGESKSRRTVAFVFTLSLIFVFGIVLHPLSHGCVSAALRPRRGLYSISSFTYCARFVFPVSYLTSRFTFFLISYLINLCLCVGVCGCGCPWVCGPKPFAYVRKLSASGHLI